MSARTRVFVVGMHRSGTSALTAVLGRLGFFVGESQELMPAKSDNPRGFWERQKVSDLHHAILAGRGASWDRPLSALQPEFKVFGVQFVAQQQRYEDLGMSEVD